MAYIKKGEKYPSVEKQLKEIQEFFEGPVDKKTDYFFEYSMNMAVQLDEELKERNWKQKDLAEKLGKSPSEIHKWLSGVHNFTLDTIAKISSVLDKKIIFTLHEIKEKQKRPVKVINLSNSYFKSPGYPVKNSSSFSKGITLDIRKKVS